jgi:hypothetical protein
MLCMWCVSALAMCCAASEIERCVIVMVQLCCWVFTFVVFVGDGWLALVPTHLPHLRRLDLEGCGNVSSECLEELVAAIPGLVAINCRGRVVTPVNNKTICNESAQTGR